MIPAKCSQLYYLTPPTRNLQDNTEGQPGENPAVRGQGRDPLHHS